MEARIARSALVAALGHVSYATNAANIIPSLGNIKLTAKGGKMVFAASDGSIAISSAVASPDCTIAQEGQVAIPARLLIKLASSLPPCEVKLKSVKGEKLKISAGDGLSAELKCANEAFCEAHDGDKELADYAINASMLHEMLRGVVHAQSKDDTRIMLKSVLMRYGKRDITVAATNGRVLAECKYENSADKESAPQGIIDDLLIPSAASNVLFDCAAFGGDGEIKISAAKNPEDRTFAIFEKGGAVLRTTLVAGKFPAYEKITPKPGKNVALVEREALLTSVKRASILSPAGDSGYVMLTFADNAVRVVSQKSDAGVIDESIVANYLGEKISIGIAARYLIPVLKAVDDDEIAINIYSPADPLMIVCKAKHRRFMSLVMPMRGV